MLTAISALLNKKNTKTIIKPFLETGEISFYLGRASNLLEEMNEGFCLEHIVEVFWLTTDLQDTVNENDNLTEAEQNLLNAIRNWSRNQYGFCRASLDMPCSAKNIFVGGDLGYPTGMLPLNSLQGLTTQTIEYYCTTNQYEHLSKTYEKLFIAIISQFKDLLKDLLTESKNESK
jgi:hypothetical protein